MYFEDLAVGDVELSDEIDADRDDMIAHARANDPCPIHIDPDAARWLLATGPT